MVDDFVSLVKKSSPEVYIGRGGEDTRGSFRWIDDQEVGDDIFD